MAEKFRKILVPVNGNHAGEGAFRLACQMAKENKAQVCALHVIEVGQELPLDADVNNDAGEAILTNIEALAKEEKTRVAAVYVQARHAGPAIVREAHERDFEVIVMGIPYKRRFGQFTLGDTSSHILKHASCPVLVVREKPAPGRSSYGIRAETIP